MPRLREFVRKSIEDGMRDDLHYLRNKISDLTVRLDNMTDSDIRLMCGEMTAGEMRTVKAFKSWVVRELKDF